LDDLEDDSKARIRQDAKIEEERKQQEQMKETCIRAYNDLSDNWIQRFLLKNRNYIMEGDKHLTGIKNFLQDGALKVILMDYNMTLEQEALLVRTKDEESGLYYYSKKNQNNLADGSIIQELFPMGPNFIGLKISARNLIYVFMREQLNEDECKDSGRNNEKGNADSDPK